jgi:hypothetical protein
LNFPRKKCVPELAQRVKKSVTETLSLVQMASDRVSVRYGKNVTDVVIFECVSEFDGQIRWWKRTLSPFISIDFEPLYRLIRPKVEFLPKFWVPQCTEISAASLIPISSPMKRIYQRVFAKEH